MSPIDFKELRAVNPIDLPRFKLERALFALTVIRKGLFLTRRLSNANDLVLQSGILYYM
jgi:hypothetical protein